jgi:hypothetical protein
VVLGDLAQRANNSSVRLYAVKTLTDENKLFDIARTDPDSKVRLAATEKLSNEGELSNIAVDDADADVRLAALRKITDEKLLCFVLRNSHIYAEALNETRVLRRLSSSSLREIVEHGKSVSVRQLAGKVFIWKEIVEYGSTDYDLVAEHIKQLGDDRINWLI